MRAALKHIKQLETWEWMRQLTDNDEKASPDGTLTNRGRQEVKYSHSFQVLL